MSEIKLMNMCMIQNLATDQILVQDKVGKYWSGIAFCGGHIEKGESIVHSVIREIKEESGYDISELKSCGVVHWAHSSRDERWLIFLYKTNTYQGELISETEEGKVYWINRSDLAKQKWAPYMSSYLQMFFDDELSEVYATWDENMESDFAFL